MTEPLVILHHEQEGKHWFVANRLHFTLPELKEAPIKDAPTMPVLSAIHEGRRYSIPHQIFFEERTGIMHYWVEIPGGKGFSTTFDRKTYSYLIERFGRETPLFRGQVVLGPRRRHLRKMGIDPYKPTTVGAMHDAALRREKKLEQWHSRPKGWLRRLFKF